jgi:LPPG:FO 2-phospho-L-lactate transferase
MLVLLTGGTGGAKLIHGLSREVDPAQLTIICNTADDFIMHGLYVSPDLDTIMYTLAGLSDTMKGWGIRGDTFAVLEQLEKLGAETWFKLGDRDMATHMTRTRLLREGLKLSDITDGLRKKLGIRATIIPMSNDRIETKVVTAAGELSFQDYFVKQRWQPEVKRVFYAGAEQSSPAPGLREAIGAAAAIIICPSNPITSIGPILAVPGVQQMLRDASVPIVGVSPLIGKSAISGPAHKLMAACGRVPSSLGVAQCYADFLDKLVIDSSDERLRREIEALDIEVAPSSIAMHSADDKARLAREVLALLEK